jgi:hypothetical protein
MGTKHQQHPKQAYLYGVFSTATAADIWKCMAQEDFAQGGSARSSIWQDTIGLAIAQCKLHLQASSALLAVVACGSLVHASARALAYCTLGSDVKPEWEKRRVQGH